MGMRLVIAIAAIALAQPAAAMTYFLSSDLGVEGFMRYCEFSDGKVYTVNSTELCPMSIEVGGAPTPSGIMGFKKGEYQDGMTKVCVYDVLGSERAVRVDSYELCPISPQF